MGQAHAQRIDDGPCGVILDGKNISDLPVEAFTPQVVALRRIDKLSCDADAAPGTTDAALQHSTRVQPATDFADIPLHTPKRERGSASCDAEARQP